jgi:hypothetical protein
MLIDKLIVAVKVDNLNGHIYTVSDTDTEDFNDTVANNPNCRAHTNNVMVVSHREFDGAQKIADKLETAIPELQGKSLNDIKDFCKKLLYGVA